MRFSKRFARVSGLEKALNKNWVGWLVGWLMTQFSTRKFTISPI